MPPCRYAATPLRRRLRHRYAPPDDVTLLHQRHAIFRVAAATHDAMMMLLLRHAAFSHFLRCRLPRLAFLL